ncbi:MAG TPA: hypothetical protein VK864_16535 [Longimicrobiales bacterium]|nr:hypothetical protein [Longimicrobiales bacterium]
MKSALLHKSAVFAALVAAPFLSSCSDEATTAPGSRNEPQAAVQLVTPLIEVTVTLNGAPVLAPYLVTVVNSQFGPFRADNSLTMTPTVNGYAAFENLRTGDYCVHVRPLTLSDATGNFTFVAPTTGYEPSQSGNEQPVVYIGRRSSAPVTAETYAQYCIDDPVISLRNGNSKTAIEVPLIPASGSASVQVQYVDPSGFPQATGGWAVVDLSGVNVPWFGLGMSGAGVKAGFLSGTGAPNGFVDVNSLPPGVPFVLESGIAVSGNHGQLTSTWRFTTPSAGQTENLGTIVLEPLLCTIQRDAESDTDGTPGKINFLGPIKAGFRASYGVPLTRQNDLGIFYSQSGTGTAELRMRFDAGGSTLTLNAEYSWDGLNGTLGRVGGTAIDAGVTVQVAFAVVPEGVRVTWQIGNVPAGTTFLSYFLTTQGDQAPDAARDGSASGFSSIIIPTVCTGGQGNDDQWWLPM